MSAGDGWLVIAVGITSVLMGITMLAKSRQRVDARRIGAVHRLRVSAELMGGLGCAGAVAAAIVGLQLVVAIHPGSVGLWAAVHGVPAFLAGASVARLCAVVWVVRDRRRRLRALRRRIGGRG